MLGRILKSAVDGMSDGMPDGMPDGMLDGMVDGMPNRASFFCTIV